MGGNPNPGRCPGPCDLTAIEGRYANYYSPDTPAAVYARGQRVQIKYQRNNHGPGGFVRHTLVPPSEMMSKAAHARNAFSYSCFGATPVRAGGSEIGEDKWGFSLVGNDGSKGIEAGYYVSTVTIPDVVPDGKYVLGWVWYGGTGGPVSNGPYTEEPYWKGFFGDYWSCSFVEVRGGNPLAAEFTPVFDNDMDRWSDVGCRAGNDAPGVCNDEPCHTVAEYQAPREFKGGAPAPLTPENFGGVGEESGETTEPEPTGVMPRSGTLEEAVDDASLKKACQCLALGTRCRASTSRRTAGLCKKKTPPEYQDAACRDGCCDFCQRRGTGYQKVCAATNVRRVCA